MKVAKFSFSFVSNGIGLEKSIPKISFYPAGMDKFCIKWHRIGKVDTSESKDWQPPWHG